MLIQDYVDQLNLRYKSGISREHSYRGDLQTLLKELLPDLLITNEPARSEVGAPDYILTKGKSPGGYIGTTDLSNVPKTAWEFYIGGYQPAEKWLKDRRDRELTIDDIRHYQKIIVALMETDRLMREIDGVWEP